MKRLLFLVFVAFASVAFTNCGTDSKNSSDGSSEKGSIETEVFVSADSLSDVEMTFLADTASVDNSMEINGHKFVDLGLPSGLLWAETNIGAKTAADLGVYFAWGETDLKNKESYDRTSYKFDLTEDEMAKYNNGDGKEFLDKEDDAAYVNWGSSCRMPSLAEFRELFEQGNCTMTWGTMTSSSGASVRVCKITSVRNGNSIFFPSSGYYEGSEYERSSIAEEINLWASEVDVDRPSLAGSYMVVAKKSYGFGLYRCGGLQIRPVAEQ